MISVIFLTIGGMSLYMLLKPETIALPYEDKEHSFESVRQLLKRMAAKLNG